MLLFPSAFSDLRAHDSMEMRLICVVRLSMARLDPAPIWTEVGRCLKRLSDARASWDCLASQATRTPLMAAAPLSRCIEKQALQCEKKEWVFSP